MPEDRVTIMSELTGKKRHCIHPDLEQDELWAIGYVTVQWAHLEHALLLRSIEEADKAGVPLPQDTENLSFTRRLRAFRLLIEETGKEPDRKRWLRLVSKIGNLESRRHQVSHGLWDWDHAHPEKLQASSFRPRVAFSARYDADKLQNLGLDIGAVNFELQFPGGIKSVQPLGSYASRSALLYLASKDRERQARDAAILQEPKPPLSPSED